MAEKLDTIPWSDIKEKQPENLKDCLLKTDCPDCPINTGMYFRGNFTILTLCQCDKHYLNKKQFNFVAKAQDDEINHYLSRITHWCAYNRPVF